jgi:hypothetical protein
MIFLTVCSLAVNTRSTAAICAWERRSVRNSTDQTKYVMGEPIIVRYTVKNVSNGPLFVPKSQWDIRCGDAPHLWARLEDNSGKHYEPGYGGSCLGPSPEDRMSVPDRMQKDAVLVRPGQAVHGRFTFQPSVLNDLKPGSYRLEAVLYGWSLSFNSSELSDLHRMGAPFLFGETHATTHVEFQVRLRIRSW